MALTLIVITDQIRCIRINKRGVHKRINERHDDGLAITGKWKGVHSPSHMLVLKGNGNASYHMMME